MEEQVINDVFRDVREFLDEKQKRLLAASFARALGKGGRAKVIRASSLSDKTIDRGTRELDSGDIEEDRIRKTGGGRTGYKNKHPEVVNALEKLIDIETKGDPMSPLKWTSKSLRNLSDELKKQGHDVGYNIVAKLLKELGYSLQANVKDFEDRNHEDRNEQFEHINKTSKKFLENGDPVISVDTKKKELIGEYKNNGRELRPKEQPRKVKAHDFVDPDLGKAIPYGVYDIGENSAWVNVGTDHDTAAFAIASIASWWESMGKHKYSLSKKLLINADGGGSNGYRNKLWKVKLQELSNKIGLKITVNHFPPGTSKWNKIEHRLFSHITMNWRGKPLVDHQTIINLIGSTKTKKGLTVEAKLDVNKYPTGIKISDKELKKLNLEQHCFHGEWNYTIKPHRDNILLAEINS